MYYSIEFIFRSFNWGTTGRPFEYPFSNTNLCPIGNFEETYDEHFCLQIVVFKKWTVESPDISVHLMNSHNCFYKTYSCYLNITYLI